MDSDTWSMRTGCISRELWGFIAHKEISEEGDKQVRDFAQATKQCQSQLQFICHSSGHSLVSSHHELFFHRSDSAGVLYQSQRQLCLAILIPR
mmetsp:Transcript_5849/g.36262  ORF Transcript_5849/g.36262 Transcript_5849/m.36262 type:complete len:93 (-) Transcript_5849:4894-5172(-)